jgi:hypothetical protein
MTCLSRFYFYLSMLLVLSITFISGCGDNLPKRVPIAGIVLIDGKPLEKGVIQVFPKGERLAYGSIGPDGKFTLTTFTENDGTMIGKHPVTVSSFDTIGSTGAKWFAPKKYSSIITSGLELDVTGQKNDVVIKLTWDGGKPYIEKY